MRVDFRARILVGVAEDDARSTVLHQGASWLCPDQRPECTPHLRDRAEDAVPGRLAFCPSTPLISSIDCCSRCRSVKAARSSGVSSCHHAFDPGSHLSPRRLALGPGRRARQPGQQRLGLAVLLGDDVFRAPANHVDRAVGGDAVQPRCRTRPVPRIAPARCTPARSVSWTTSSASASLPVMRYATRKTARLCRSTSVRKRLAISGFRLGRTNRSPSTVRRLDGGDGRRVRQGVTPGGHGSMGPWSMGGPWVVPALRLWTYGPMDLWT